MTQDWKAYGQWKAQQWGVKLLAKLDETGQLYLADLGPALGRRAYSFGKDPILYHALRYLLSWELLVKSLPFCYITERGKIALAIARGKAARRAALGTAGLISGSEASSEIRRRRRLIKTIG